MLTSNTAASRSTLRTEFQSLKQLTQRKDGTPEDIDTLPNSVYTQSEDRFQNETGIEGLKMSTQTFGNLDSGNYSNYQTMSLHDETTFQRNVDYQESDSGEVSYTELIDTDGNGTIDVKNKGTFDLNQPEAILLK